MPKEWDVRAGFTGSLMADFQESAPANSQSSSVDMKRNLKKFCSRLARLVIGVGCLIGFANAVNAQTTTGQGSLESMQVQFPVQRIGISQGLPSVEGINKEQLPGEYLQTSASMPDPDLTKMSRRLDHVDWQTFEQKLVELWGDRIQARAEDERGSRIRILIPGNQAANNQMVIDRSLNAVTFEGDPVVAEHWGALIDLLDRVETGQHENVRLVGLGNATAATVRRAVGLLGIPEDNSATLAEAIKFAPFATASAAHFSEPRQRMGQLRSIPFRPGLSAGQSAPQSVSPSRAVNNQSLQRVQSHPEKAARIIGGSATVQRTVNSSRNGNRIGAGMNLMPSQENANGLPVVRASTLTPMPTGNGIPAMNAGMSSSNRRPTRTITFTTGRSSQQEEGQQGQIKVVEMPDDTLDGTVKIRVVPELNAIFLIGPAEDVAKVKAMIENIVSTARESQPISQLYNIKNADSAKLKITIDQVYGAAYATNNGAAEIIAISSPNALMVVAQQPAHLIIGELIKKLDIESPDTDESLDFRIFKLKHMSAVDAGTRLQGYFRETSAEGNQGVQELQPGNWIAAFEGLVSIIVDYRSNSLIVKGNQRVLKNAERIIAELDVDEGGASHEVRFFQIYNTLASDVAGILQNAINGQLEGAPQVFAPGNQQLQGANQAGGALFSQSRSNMPVPMLKMTTVDRNGVTVQSGILLNVKVTADANSNQLMISGPAKSMDLIAALIRQLDRIPDAETQIKVFTIYNGDANDLLTTLQNIFGSDQNQGQGGIGQGATTGQLPLQTASTSNGAALINLRFGVDSRTNSIIASGPAGDLQVIEDLLNRLDEQDLLNRINHVHRLSNAPAEDVALAINDWLDGRQAVLDNDPTTDDPFVSARRQVVVVEELVTNSLIISANPEYFSEVMRLIESLDRRPQMVKIKVLIAEVDLDKVSEFGVEIGIQDSLLFDRGLGVIGFPFNQSGLGNNADALALSTRDLLAGQAISNLSLGRTNSNLGYGGLVLTAGNESINVLIRALQDRGIARVLSTPDIMTVDNLQGRIQVGQQVPRITGASQNDSGGTTTDVEDVDVGVILAVTPRISPDGMIIMTVDAVNSQLGDEEDGVPVFVSEGQVVRSPPIDITQAQTTIMARSGQTVAFTGLIRDAVVESKRGIPILSDLPVIGPLFSFERKVHLRTELLIVLTPYIVDSDAQIEASNQAAMSRMHWCMDDVSTVFGSIGYGGFDPENLSGTNTPTYFPDDDPTGEHPEYTPLENRDGESSPSDQFPDGVFDRSAVPLPVPNQQQPPLPGNASQNRHPNQRSN